MGVLFRSRDVTGVSRGLNAAALSPSAATSDTIGLPLVRATLPPVSPWSGAVPTPSPVQTMPAGDQAGWATPRVPLTPTFAETNFADTPRSVPSLTKQPAERKATASQPVTPQPVSLPAVMRQAAAPSTSIEGSAAAPQPVFTPTVRPIAEPATAVPAAPLPTTPSPVAPPATVPTNAAAPIVPSASIAVPAQSVQRQPTVSQAAATPDTVIISTTTPPAAQPIMRAAAPEAATTSAASAVPATSDMTPPVKTDPATSGEPTLDREWSRLERIMHLHRKRAEEAGAEPGVIPAPPPPAEPTHLQKMEEKQKRIYTPSRMPPPELRRRAEVVTFSPEEAKGKATTAPSTPASSSAPVTPTAQRSALPEPETAQQPQPTPTQTASQPIVARTEAETSDVIEAAATSTASPVTPIQPQTSTTPVSGEVSHVPPQAEPTTIAAPLPTTPQISGEPESPSAQRELVASIPSESAAQPTAAPQNLQRQVSAPSESSDTEETADLSAPPAMVESGNVSAAAPSVTPVQRQTEAQAIPSAPEQIPVDSVAPVTSVTPPVPQSVQRQVEPVVHGTKTAQPEAIGTVNPPIVPTEHPLTQTVSSAAPVPGVEGAIVQTMPAAAASPTVQPVQRLAEQPDLPSPEKTTKPAAADTSVPTQPLSPQVQQHPVEQGVPVMRQPEMTTPERLSDHTPALTESEPATTVIPSAESVQRQTVPTTPSSVPAADSPPEIETPLPTNVVISRMTEPEPMRSMPDFIEALTSPAEPAAAPVQRAVAEPGVPDHIVETPLATQLSSPMASDVPDSSVQRAVAPSLGRQPEPEVETKPAPSVQRVEAAPTRVETGMAAPLPVVKARPLSELVTPATLPETPALPADVSERTTAPVQRAAATPSPDITPTALPPSPPAAATPLTPITAPVLPAAALPASEAATTAPLVQRVAEPEPLASVAATQSDVSELDMPTMIMPTPVGLSQPETKQGVTAPPLAVQRHVETPQTAQPVPAAPDAAAAPEPEPERWSLADVWPVQRKEEPRPAPEHEGLEPAEIAEPVRHDKPEAGQVKHVMRQVAAAKPSDSSVELILPRRQRPTLPPRTPVPSAPTVQTQRESNGGSHKPETPQAFVPTEIGPLPGDLWEILGTPVPVTAPAAAPASTTLAPAATQTSVMRAIAAAESQPPQHTFHNGNGTHMEAIQRAETAPEQSRPTSTATAGSGVPPRTATAQEGQSGQGTEGGEQGEVNVDELARQVYHEVRRRLSVEWERGRGRF